MNQLTAREIDCIRHLPMDGAPKQEVIGQALDVPANTVKNDLWRASRKLGVYASWTGLLVEALRRGELALWELVAPAHVKGEEHES